MDKLKNYIDGHFLEPKSGQYLENIDPATGQVYSLIPDSDIRDVDEAVNAAEKAFPIWSNTPAEERSRILLKIADIIESRLDEFAMAECIDNGKPLKLAKALDIPRAVINFRFFATAILHFRSESHETDNRAINYTLRKPRGIAGLISPWNLPLYLLSWKVAPALAAGNTAIAKPSEVTPMTAYLLSEVCQKAGLPPGVLNIIHGLGSKAGAAIVSHKKINTISFTGGTSTGIEIAKASAPLLKRISLELGGKNPNIIFSDADLDEVVEASVKASFSNQGQICLSGSRIFVEASIYASFLDRFVAAARKLQVGDPLEDSTDQGAIVSKTHMDKIRSYIHLAREEGGRIVLGGKEPSLLSARCKNGYFLEPTVITDISINSRVNQEEIFGPVVTIAAFYDENDAVRMANATEYGLAASLWTQNLTRAHRIAERLQSGTVWINCWMLRDLRVPFGGMKNSGIGREGGEEALRFFTEPKNVCVQLTNGVGGRANGK